MDNEIVIEHGVVKKSPEFAQRTLVIEEGIKQIEAEAFYWNGYLREVVLPNGLERIGAGAFARCVALKRIYIPKTVHTIEKDAFKECHSLEIFCEGERCEDWVEKFVKETVIEEVVTPEDDAFNFHRSSGGFTSHTYEREVERWISWNPDKRPVHENVSREEFLKLC